MKFKNLLGVIKTTQDAFLKKHNQYVNVLLSVRNWLLGYFIFEFEQKGEDRAEYGEELLIKLSKALQKEKYKGFSETQLIMFRKFYLKFPDFKTTIFNQLKTLQIPLTLSDKSIFKIPPTASEEFRDKNESNMPDSVKHNNNNILTGTEVSQNQLNNLEILYKLTFSHFVELLKLDSGQKIKFYISQTISLNWTVRQLRREIESMLYERIGLSKNKKQMITNLPSGLSESPLELVKNPYVLEFLGIEEKAEYSENDLEKAIIDNLQKFLLELGYGFCFEARQKRILIENIQYKIDLVFYHRILKCHVLIDLKVGSFSHADAGQMNFYLNHYKSCEMHNGDNPPIGIILCAYKNETLVKYATGSLDKEIFVSKYLINLPKEDELKKLIEKDLP